MTTIRNVSLPDGLIEIQEVYGPLPYSFMIVHHGDRYEFPSLRYRYASVEDAVVGAKCCVEWVTLPKGAVR